MGHLCWSLLPLLSHSNFKQVFLPNNPSNFHLYFNKPRHILSCLVNTVYLFLKKSLILHHCFAKMGNSCNPKKKKKKRSRKKVATRRRSRKRKNNRKIANALPAKQSQVASLVSQPVCQTSKVTPIKILKKGQPRNQTTATPKGSTMSIALPTSSLASSQNSSAVPNLDLRTGSGPKNPTETSIASLVRCNAAKRDKVMQLQLNQLLQSIYHRVQATQKQTGGKVVPIKGKQNEDLLSSDKLRAHGLTSRQILKSGKLSFDHRLAQNIKEHAPLSLNVDPAKPSSAKKPAQRLKK